MTRAMGWLMLCGAVLLGGGGLTACKQRQSHAEPPTTRKKKDINRRFLHKNVNVRSWKNRFESPKREVYKHRKAIVAAIGHLRGLSVADVGAGTGAFLTTFRRAIGPKGMLYLVEISPGFVRFLRKRVKANKHVKVVKSTTTSTHLPANSVDVVFLCDTYHHFDKAEQMLADFRKVLRPKGRLVIVDFKRIPGVSDPWILNHVKVNEQQVTRQVLQNGFNLERKVNLPQLKENYMLIFRRQ